MRGASAPAGDAGLTLMEVMVALVLLALIVGASARGLRSTLNFQGENARQERAIFLAQEKMEELRAEPFDQLESADPQAVEPDSEGFTVSWTVEENPVLETDGPREKGMKLVTVSVTWNWKGETRTYEVQSVFSELNSRF